MNEVVVYSRPYIYFALASPRFPGQTKSGVRMGISRRKGGGYLGSGGRSGRITSRRRVTSISMCPVAVLSLYHSETVHAVRTY